MLTIDPLLPLWAIALLVLPLVAICVWCLVSRPGVRVDWVRRLLMVVAIAVIAVRPVTTEDALATKRMNANVIFVVDRTGSMNAEDYAGNQPRIEGVKSDIRQIMDMTKGARFGIISFDSSASAQLPLTTDAGAVEAWVDTLKTENTAFSKGSNVDRPREALASLVQQTNEEDPTSHLFVYVMSDGENTDNRESEPFSQISPQIDAGAVLGYGTAAGGPMRAVGGESDGEYIQDPGGGQGISRLDAANLQNMASQLGVAYVQRTGDGADLTSTMQGITLEVIDSQEELATSRFEDWYWIASIILSGLAIWELAALTYRMPRPIDATDLAHMSRRMR